MTPQAQRIAIAEAYGWTNISEVNPPDGSGSFWVGINKIGHECFLPDYLSDLNAMQLAFQILTSEQKRTCTYYCITLLEKGQFLFDATAAQWVEAFLRTT